MMLTNKTVLVTGASIGIGRAIACLLAQNGATVVLSARSIQGLNETKAQITRRGGDAVIIPADLQQLADIEALAENINTNLGGADIIVHTAGVWHDENKAFTGVPLVGIPLAQIRQVMEVGIMAPMILTRLLLPKMIAKKAGKIIGISGTFSYGAAGWMHYFVAKQALEKFLEGLSQELREHYIQVNCVCPSDVASESMKKFFPEDAKLALSPEEVAKLCLFLLSEGSDNITGQRIVVKHKIDLGKGHKSM